MIHQKIPLMLIPSENKLEKFAIPKNKCDEYTNEAMSGVLFEVIEALPEKPVRYRLTVLNTMIAFIQEYEAWIPPAVYRYFDKKVLFLDVLKVRLDHFSEGFLTDESAERYLHGYVMKTSRRYPDYRTVFVSHKEQAQPRIKVGFNRQALLTILSAFDKNGMIIFDIPYKEDTKLAANRMVEFSLGDGTFPHFGVLMPINSTTIEGQQIQELNLAEPLTKPFEEIPKTPEQKKPMKIKLRSKK